MARHNFTSETRHVIAARAGFRCSYPGCGQLTVGPAKSVDTFEDTGFASHIYAASESGPRGQGGLSPDQLKHATNGIWMCGEHETLIDKESGVRFPVHVLQSWKALHEYRVSYEHSGRQAAFGFVRRLVLHKSPRFAPGTSVDFAKTTFLIGPNGSGKSAVCEWLTVLDTSLNVNRWLSGRPLEYTITFDAPAEHQLRVRTTGGSLVLELDKSAVSRNYARSATVYLHGRGDPAILCDLQRIMRLFGVEELALRSLIAQVSGRFATSLKFLPRDGDEDEDGKESETGEASFELHCTLANGSTLTLAQLSGGEEGRILLEIAMTMAQEATQFGPVMLIVEIKSLAMDWGALEPYLAHFASADCLYQTVVTSWELPQAVEMLGWQVFTLTAGGAETGTVTPTPVQ